MSDLAAKVHRILRDDWNPIGFDDSLPDDEYVRYEAAALELAKLSARFDQQSFVVDYLLGLEMLIFSGSPSGAAVENAQITAKKLIQTVRDRPGFNPLPPLPTS